MGNRYMGNCSCCCGGENMPVLATTTEKAYEVFTKFLAHFKSFLEGVYDLELGLKLSYN